MSALSAGASAGALQAAQRRVDGLTEEVEKLHAALVAQRTAASDAAKLAESERHRLSTSLLEKGNEVAALVAENEKLHGLYRAARVRMESLQHEADRLALTSRHKDDAATTTTSTLVELQARYEEVCALVSAFAPPFPPPPPST
jgi:predicted nuclease with TOPRIM domain